MSDLLKVCLYGSLRMHCMEDIQILYMVAYGVQMTANNRDLKFDL